MVAVVMSMPDARIAPSAAFLHWSTTGAPLELDDELEELEPEELDELEELDEELLEVVALPPPPVPLVSEPQATMAAGMQMAESARRILRMSVGPFRSATAKEEAAPLGHINPAA
jgi:hypothetical protein